MNAIVTQQGSGWIRAELTITSGSVASTYLSIGNCQPRAEHHERAARNLLDLEYPGWEVHYTFHSAWLSDGKYVHIADLIPVLGEGQ